MKALNQAIYSRLNADLSGTAANSLGTLGMTAVFFKSAPQTGTVPYVIFNKQTGINAWQFSGVDHRSFVYQIKAVTSGHSSLVGSQVDDRLDALMNDQPLTVSGWSCIRIRRETDVDYGEEAEGVIYQHVGGMFRIDLEPS